MIEHHAVIKLWVLELSHSHLNMLFWFNAAVFLDKQNYNIIAFSYDYLPHNPINKLVFILMFMYIQLCSLRGLPVEEHDYKALIAKRDFKLKCLDTHN